MQIKAVLLAAFATYGVADAVCAMQAYSGDNCDGSIGKAIGIGKGASCINVSGRGSYKIYGGTCGAVRVTMYEGSSCSGSVRSVNDLGTGCHPINRAVKKMSMRKK